MVTNESHTRSIIKGVTWRVIASLTTMTVVYIFTGDVSTTLFVGGLEATLKIFFYYVHERAWGMVTFGLVRAQSLD